MIERKHRFTIRFNDGEWEVSEEKIASAFGENPRRGDMVKFFKAAGYEVPRQGAKYITVKDPSEAKGLRLKGAVYNRDFDSSKGAFLTEAKAQKAARLAASPVKLERSRGDLAFVLNNAGLFRPQPGQSRYQGQEEARNPGLHRVKPWSLVRRRALC